MVRRFFTITTSLLGLLLSRVEAEVAVARITTIHGKSADQVTDCSKEQDGRLRIVHAGGVWRIQQTELTKESQIALGLRVETGPLKFVGDLKTLQTIDGRIFGNLRNCVVSPSGVQFIHASGPATLRFSELPEEFQKRFGYDEVKGAAYDQHLAEARRLTEEVLLLQLLAAGPSQEVRSDAIWVDSGSPGTRARVVRKVGRSEARALAGGSSGPWVWIAGYYRNDGTYVLGHYRTEPDSSMANNWSTEGNRNPTSGELGDVTPLGSPGYSSGSVHVGGYYRKDGTHVRSHSRRK